jgi:PKD repeat protein
MLGVHSTANPETEIVITAEGQPETTNRYFFMLEIADNDGGVFDSFERFGELSYLDITNGPNLSPVAEFTMDKTTISVGDSITFVSTSYDPQGDVLPNDAYLWDFDGDGEFDDTSSGSQVNRQYNTPGEYIVRLKVIHRGLSTSTMKTVYVEPTQSLPQAAFTYEVDNNTVTFDAGNSRYDPDLPDTTLRYEWDFDIESDSNGNGINDDDIESTEFAPSYTYPQVGIYRVRLKVKDTLGMEGVVVRDINLAMSAQEKERNTYRSLKVSSPNQPLTTLEVSILPMQVSKGGTADIDVSVINADGSPYSGQIFFEILDGSGDFIPNSVNAKDSKASTIFSSVDSGPVRIRVRATETYFGDIEEEATINVK